MAAARAFVTAVLGLLLLASASVAQTPSPAPAEAYIQAPEPVRALFARDKHVATLDDLSPDGQHFLVPHFNEVSSNALMGQKTYRLAMLELCPDVNREWRLSTFGFDGLQIYSLAARKTWPVRIPAKSFVSDWRWSPDGTRLAFVAHEPTRSRVWVATVATGDAQPLGETAVLATLAGRPEFGDRPPSRLLQWTADGAVVTLAVPDDRGPEPAEPARAPGPQVRSTREKPTPTTTQPFLLRTATDAARFRYYTTAQLVRLRAGQPAQKLGEPAMYLDFTLAPDGKHVLRDRIVEPFSYLVAFQNFGTVLEVLDDGGTVVSTIRQRPLREAQRTVGGNEEDEDLPREVVWRPDGRGLAMLWREPKPEGAARPEVVRRDRLMFLAPPFDVARAETVASTEHRLSAARYSGDGRWAFVKVGRRLAEGNARREDLVAVDLGTAAHPWSTLVRDTDPRDPLALPGEVMTRESANGVAAARVSPDGTAVFLEGKGYRSDFRPRPFVDRVTIRTSQKERLFEGSGDAFEKPLVALDANLTRLVISRETSASVPDSYLWAKGAAPEKLTANVDPYPEITAAKRVDFDFTRRDGLLVHARISLPVGYRDGTRVPAMFWTYPDESESPEEYLRTAIRERNRNAYTPLSFLRWSDIWLTQGYALVHTDVPIVGKGDYFNDQFVSQASDTLFAAIRKLDALGYIDPDRVGHGGHSYGAFTTANLLAHTPYFKAGIAGDGAYNRSLTPMTFQSERRSLWEAPTTYLEMSPFFYADQINTPLLMYHGADDNNSGTFVIQSERMIQALTGLGKTAVLYVYPYESHAPRSIENLSDLWARWIDWFDRYVKGARPAPGTGGGK